MDNHVENAKQVSASQPQIDYSGLRIDVKRLAGLLIYALLLPGAVAISLDLLLGLFPLLTLGAVVTLFPIAGFIILRNAVREMNQIADQVAPEEDESQEDEDEAEADAASDDVASQDESEFWGKRSEDGKPFAEGDMPVDDVVEAESGASVHKLPDGPTQLR